MELMQLTGKVAVITGGGAGLGRECALLFAEQGAKVVVADINLPRAEATAQVIAERGGEAIARLTDVAKEADVESSVKAAIDHYGKLDIMMANAGVRRPSTSSGESIPLEDVSEEQWRTVIDINLSGVFFSIKHAARVMKTSGGGSIVVTSSAAASRAFPGSAVYCASKGGVNMLVTAAAVDLGDYGIRVNALCPLFGMSANFHDPSNDEVIGKSYEQVRGNGKWNPDERRMPLRVSRPPVLRDHAVMALFLASDLSEYMSGACIPTGDGGSVGRVGVFY
jgi:NAD(P)-dependent dehydrogenase (short-subunit alcohol dehydrogenase family)